MSQAAEPQASAAAERAVAKGRRKRLFTILGLVILGSALLYLLYWFLIGSRSVSTDDAYVQAEVAQVTALVSGAVIKVPVTETQMVQKGQVLAVIDPADFQLAVDRARAELGQSERRVKGYYANDRALAAQTAAKTTDIARAQADLARAQTEYGRRKSLAGSGAVSGDELTVAENQLQTARAGLAQARANAVAASEQRRVAEVLIEGSDVRNNPEVAVARAHLAQAELDLARTVIRAPVTGLVAKKSIQVGQRVQAGAQMMSVVPVQKAYVDANFKEVQLRHIEVGAPATLTADIYGRGVKFHGKVVGVAGGSGAAFALIPAQNATGNWIKVVQRVPVRISLDPRELEKHPLRVGLSMNVDVEAR